MTKQYDPHDLDVGGNMDHRRGGEQDRVAVTKTCNGFPAAGQTDRRIDERSAQADGVGNEDRCPSGRPEDNDDGV